MNMVVYPHNGPAQSDSASGTKRLSQPPVTSLSFPYLRWLVDLALFQHSGSEKRPTGGVSRPSPTGFTQEATLGMWLGGLEVPRRWRLQGAPSLCSTARGQAMAFGRRVLRLYGLAPRIEATTDGGVILTYTLGSQSSAHPVELFIECDGDGETMAAVEDDGEIVFSGELESLQDVDQVVERFLSRASS